jgi:ABC-type branched-subunit amino acid transport system ATPase component
LPNGCARPAARFAPRWRRGGRWAGRLRLGGWLLVDFFARAGAGAAPGDPGTALLVVYWALSLPMLGHELALQVQQIPGQRNLTLRLVEPLGAPEDEVPASAAPPRLGAEGGVAIRLEGVRVVAAGNEILDVGALSVAPGEQVAIVGASGPASRPARAPARLAPPRRGAGPVDGAPLIRWRSRRSGGGRWVDPTVYLWNRSLAANLTFGLATTPRGWPVLAGADLEDVVARLPQGVETPLGEAGGLLSGGEGSASLRPRALRADPALVLLDEPFRGSIASSAGAARPYAPALARRHPAVRDPRHRRGRDVRAFWSSPREDRRGRRPRDALGRARFAVRGAAPPSGACGLVGCHPGAASACATVESSRSRGDGGGRGGGRPRRRRGLPLAGRAARGARGAARARGGHHRSARAGRALRARLR